MNTLYEDLHYIWGLLERTKDGSYDLINASNQTATHLIIKVINEHGLKQKKENEQQ
jgi:hypothetical protein